MERRELTFRVFVSSTFSDLKAERDALQARVFPRLREYCQKHGSRFQAIDLRWGVSEEAAARRDWTGQGRVRSAVPGGRWQLGR